MLRWRPMKALFEHPDFFVFVKPAGMNFHSEEGAGFVVLASEAAGERLFPVHRLDKMTSGLVLLARSAEAARQLTERFETRRIEKYYLALSLRKPKKKQGWIRGDMLKARRGNWKLAKTTKNPALTRFVSCALREGERAFLVKPYTGKTHQIRVALKSLGSPVAGDTRYADAAEALKEERGYLHAYALRFEYGGETFSFTVAPSEGERFLSGAFAEQMKRWREPWDLFREK